MQPYTKKAPQIRARTWAPKQPHHRNNAPQPPKPASGNERALKKGGRGALPRDSLRPGFLLEKAWIPARDRAGNHVAGANLRWSRQDHLPHGHSLPKPQMPQALPQPYPRQAQPHAGQDVGGKQPRVPVLQQHQGLQGEGGEGGKAPAHPHLEEEEQGGGEVLLRTPAATTSPMTTAPTPLITRVWRGKAPRWSTGSSPTRYRATAPKAPPAPTARQLYSMDIPPVCLVGIVYHLGVGSAQTCGGVRPAPGGGRGWVPFGWAAPKPPWGAAPRGPRLPGGGPHFSREMGRKRAGGKPPVTPGSMARLLSLARFGGRAALSRSWGYFAAHLRTLIWGLSFIKCFFSIFFTRKCVPNRS